MSVTEETPEIRLPSTKELERQFREVINYFDDRYAYFLTHIIKAGRPKWSHSIPTAAVLLIEKPGQKKKNDLFGNKMVDYDFEFVFNPKLWVELGTVERRAFVVAHETFHIILNHLKIFRRYVNMDERERINDKIEKGERLTKQEMVVAIRMKQIMSKLNIAMDAVINDYLVNAGMTCPEWAIRGQNVIGENAAFLTVRDVYDLLPEQPMDSSGKIGDQDGRGEGALDSHSWLFDPDFPEQMADAIDRLNQDLEDGNKIPGDLKDKKMEEDGGETEAQKRLREAGTERGNIRAFSEVYGLTMAWAKLLKEVDPNIFKERGFGHPPVARWNKRPRKLASPAFRRSNLPVHEKNDVEKIVNEKPAIVLALDYSSSIGPDDADRFATLARSIPQDRIKVLACTFTTSYQEFDIENPHGGGNGGTNFNAIGDFIEQKVKPELNGSYPKAVVIITDGEASFTANRPDDKEAEAWLWLISPNDRSNDHNYNASRVIGRRAMLEEYTNE